MAGEGGIGGTPEHPGTNRDSNDGEWVVPGSATALVASGRGLRGRSVVIGCRVSPALRARLDFLAKDLGVSRAAALAKVLEVGVAALAPPTGSPQDGVAGRSLSRAEIAQYVQGTHQLTTVRDTDRTLLPIVLEVLRDWGILGKPGLEQITEWVEGRLAVRQPMNLEQLRQLDAAHLLPSDPDYRKAVWRLLEAVCHARDLELRSDRLREAILAGQTPTEYERGLPPNRRVLSQPGGGP